MRFNLFGNKNNIKSVRENYVQEFKVNKEITITPCNKFVAVLEKLSRNYVLALKEPEHTETLQVANQSDIEFYEGYEFAQNYTDGVRTKLSKSLYALYNVFGCIVLGFDSLERLISDKRSLLNDIKLDIIATNNIISNIYQHITMTFDIPTVEGCEEIPNNAKETLEYIKDLIIKAIRQVVDLLENTIIEYITRQLNIIESKLSNYYNMINNL